MHPSQWDELMAICCPSSASVRGVSGKDAKVATLSPPLVAPNSWPAWAEGKEFHFTSSAPLRDLETGEPRQ